MSYDQKFSAPEDWRHISNGSVIPTENYSDQPYIVETADGAWLCVITTGRGVEGQRGQHVVTLRSADCGRSWEKPVNVESADGPEASYAVLLATPSGRIYCFYNYNSADLRAVKADDPPYSGGLCKRVDSLGDFVFKYSDDGGKSWSKKRYVIPVREMEIDRRNPYGAAVRFFWNVGRPLAARGAAYVPLHKVGGFGQGFFTSSQGVLLKSANILYEKDPERIGWETLPEGETGLHSPAGGGPISEEQSAVELSDGSLYCVYRTVDGSPACAYSRDEGYSWEPPQYARYATGGRIRHPRAANFVWRCGNGKYLYWFHNHGGRSYEDRNPVWLSGGVEVGEPGSRVIAWSQPDILLYDDDPYVRISYPDLMERDGRYWITETQKSIARVHEISAEFMERLWGQFGEAKVSRRGLLFEEERAGALRGIIRMPELPAFSERAESRGRDLRGGFTIEMRLALRSPRPTLLLDSTDGEGKGTRLSISEDGSLEILLCDGRTRCSWRSGPGAVKPGSRQIAIIVDGGPKIVGFVIDGVLYDGGESMQFGWGRFSPHLRHANGSADMRLLADDAVSVECLRIYGAALSVSELVNNDRAERA